MRRLFPLLALGLLAPPLQGDEPKKAEAERIEIPYRLTAVKHILVRAKINNKGPFNFILDTGAPALFVATDVCKKLGIKEDKKGWGTFERFEIEGGLVLTKARGRIDTPFQLEGMNGMGLAGAELHGIIGYNILAQFQMEIDFTRDKMVWTRLDWTPKAPKGIEGKGGQGGLEFFGSIMKLLGSFLGRKADPDVTTRGFLGLELGEDGEDAIVKSVLPGGPAAEAGLKSGDRFVKFKGRSVYGLDGLLRFTNRTTAGEQIKVIVKRGRTGEEIELTIKPGEGL
jgi:hypothetical protein